MAVSIFSNQFVLESDDKAAIVKAWWPGDHASLDDYQAYFGFFSRELKNIPWRNISPNFGVQTLEDLRSVARLLAEHQDCPRSAVVAKLRKCLSSQEDLDDIPIVRSMELAVRLWLGLNVQTWSIAVPSEMPRMSLIQWAENKSLVDVAKDCFHWHESSKQRSRISPGFSAWKLVYLCGVKIDWTDSLSDHLRFDHGSKILMIYRHKICLLGHWTGSSADQISQDDDNTSEVQDLNGGGYRPTRPVDLEAAAEKIGELREFSPRREERSASKADMHTNAPKPIDKEITRCPLPKDLLGETMRTLDLLFPFTGDRDTDNYLQSEGQTFNQVRTPEILGLPPRALDFSEFKYWRDRLEDIHDVFASPPRSKKQLWRDRRNQKDFSTLIISLLALSLAIILGLIGLVNAVHSNDQARRANDLAEQSLRLALAQACQRQDIVQGMCPSLPSR